MPEIVRPGPEEGERGKAEPGLETLDVKPEEEGGVSPGEMVIEEPGEASPEKKLTQKLEQPEVPGEIGKNDVNHKSVNTIGQADRLTEEFNAANQQ